MLIIYLLVAFFVSLFIFLRKLEKRFISDLRKNKLMSLKWIRFVLWLLPWSSRNTSTDLRIQLHFYLVRKIIEIKNLNYFETDFLHYFKNVEKDSLLKDIIKRVGEHDLVKPRVILLTREYICRFDHNLALTNLKKVLNFPYFDELKLYSAVFEILEGRWDVIRNKMKIA